MGPPADEQRDALTAYPARQRLIEAAAIAAFALLALWNCWQLAAAVDSPARCLLIVACAVPGWAVTDFLSGLAHWMGDTWGSMRTPFVGRWFIRPFREHHADPRAMTRHDFVETNGASCIAALPVLVVAGIIPAGGDAFPFLQGLLLFTALGMLIANQCHRWAHTEPARLGPVIRRMQRLGLILSPRRHRLHHVHPFDSCYCTASGWLNDSLNAIGFFRVLECVVSKATGTVPRRDSTP